MCVRGLYKVLTMVVVMAAPMLPAGAAENIYSGPIADAHAHLPKSAGVSPSDLIELYEKAGVSQIGLFVEFRRIRKLRNRLPEQFLLFTDPYKGKRDDYRLSEKRFNRLPGLFEDGTIKGLENFIPI